MLMFGPELRSILLVVPVVANVLPSVAKSATCAEELTAFHMEMSNLALLPPAIGPAFPPDGETQSLMAASALYRAALNRNRVGQERVCLELVMEARAKLGGLKPAG